jgi:drug/metabolite transporter (DMT)-like permease
MDSVPTSKRDSWIGVLLLIACATLWSLSGALIKLLNRNGGVSALSIAFYRSLFGGVLFLPFACRHVKTLRSVSIAWPIGSVLSFTLMTACFVLATTQTAAANAIILQYTAPLWVFLLSPALLNERPRLEEGLTLLLAMAGVGVIFFGNRSGGTGGLFMALASGFGYGALTIALRGLRRAHPWAVVCLNCLGSGALLAFAVARWGSFSLTREQFYFLLLLSVLQFSLPYMLFSYALRRIEAHQASLILLLETVLNPLWTFLAVGERVPAATLAGGPLILAGIGAWMLLTWRKEALLPET